MTSFSYFKLCCSSVNSLLVTRQMTKFPRERGSGVCVWGGGGEKSYKCFEHQKEYSTFIFFNLSFTVIHKILCNESSPPKKQCIMSRVVSKPDLRLQAKTKMQIS